MPSRPDERHLVRLDERPGLGSRNAGSTSRHGAVDADPPPRDPLHGRFAILNSAAFNPPASSGRPGEEWRKKSRAFAEHGSGAVTSIPCACGSRTTGLLLGEHEVSVVTAREPSIWSVERGRHPIEGDLGLPPDLLGAGAGTGTFPASEPCVPGSAGSPKAFCSASPARRRKAAHRAAASSPEFAEGARRGGRGPWPWKWT
jgi:hypothetical protein